MKFMETEKRKLRRHKLDLPVHIHTLNERHVITSKEEKEGRLVDFSAGGCAFNHGNKVKVGDHVQLRIELNDELRKKYNMPELTVRGAIVRSVKDGTGFLTSVRFTIDR
jgi:hypothetical protein